jgi:dienelactone hydrolase
VGRHHSRRARLAGRAQQGVDANRLGIVGISLGRRSHSAWPPTTGAKALVGYSGPCPDELESAGGPLPPTLILPGQRDRVVPVSNAHRIVELLAKKGARHEAHIYPEQGHVFGGLLASMRPPGLRRSWTVS